MFTATVHDGASTFRYTMVGKNPFVTQTQPSTTVNTTLIPVVIKFSNGDTWDPRVIDSCDSQSALDAHAELAHLRRPALEVRRDTPWARVNTSTPSSGASSTARPNRPGINPGYHVTLAPKTHAALVLHVPTADAAESTTVCGTHKLGAVEINYLDTQIQHYITATLGSAATTTFPLFLLGNVVEYIGTTSDCCVLGYHGAMANAGQLQTYGVAMYDNTGDFKGSRRHRRSWRTRSASG